ncbi:phosphoglycerate dehydrogenase [Spirochaeta cellobiosiphila]|uniref:phosphoglycerate dehydrogenase n=1 Tax=Spirochaeta cellobiosiphila TaxID=504483 RepID=UPI000416FB00|nr:phosphoglycerate dehydrogenase [Spirochaeta cellobiosiphila]
MYKIQTLNKISTKGLSKLPLDNYEIASEFSKPDGIILRSFKMHDMDLPESLKAVARAGAGTNNIPIDKCSEKGIVVFNTPGANANAVKELVLTGLLLSSRKIAQGITWAQTLNGQGDEVPALIEKGKSNYVGPELMGKKLGVIGLGAIGVMVANAAYALGMEVVGYDPFISVNAAWGLQKEVQQARDLDSLISEVDYISVNVPLNDNTKGMINLEKINKMKDGVRIVNFARGGLVNNKDIIAGLKSGKVAAYVTDFPDEELIATENVIAIPHLGASTPEAEENCAVMAATQLKDFLETGNIKNSVNFPECELPITGKSRILIANKNVPNMVGQITTILAEANINIDDLLNKHRGELAYNIIELSTDVTDSVIDKLKSIAGITMVRVIKFS